MSISCLNPNDPASCSCSTGTMTTSFNPQYESYLVPNTPYPPYTQNSNMILYYILDVDMVQYLTVMDHIHVIL